MKYLIILILSLFTATAYSQQKLTEIAGSNYVIAVFEDWSKKAVFNNQVLFINTANNERTEVSFPKNVYFDRIEQIKIDSLNINKVLIAMQTDYADNKKFIDMRERPRKLIILSTDGKEQIQLTPDEFRVGTWIVNQHTGTIVVAGYYDSNGNGKRDDSDKNEILIFDLKTLKPISKS